MTEEIMISEFEKLITKSPFEFDVERYSESHFRIGRYKNYLTSLAWDAFREGVRVAEVQFKGGVK